MRQEQEKGQELEQSDSYSLPPRSTIHNVKEDNPDNTKRNTIYMIFGSIIFIAIIATILYFQFSLTSVPEETGSKYEENKTDDNQGTIDNDSEQNADDTQTYDEADASQSNEQPVEEESTDQSSNNSEEEDIIHVVKAGENLYRIAIKYYDSGEGEYVKALAEYNGLSDPNDIYAGLKLKIPPIEKLNR